MTVDNDHRDESFGYTLRDRRIIIKPPDRYEYNFKQKSLIALDGESLTYEEAIQGNNSLKRKKAMEEEMEALKKSKTWKLVQPQKNTKILDNKWVLITKMNQNGETERYKARLMVRDVKQNKDKIMKKYLGPNS